MIDIETFETLIRMQESNVLDFKIDMYDLSKDDKEYSKTAALVKDIISFTNTIRINTSYIVCGVESRDGLNILHGITKGFDDAIIQEKVKDKIYPTPKFESYILHYKEKMYGIIEFPVTNYTAFLSATIKMKNVDVGVPYYRQGSSNQEAKGRKVVEIENWIKNTKPPIGKSIYDEIRELSHRINNDINGLSQIIIDIQHLAFRHDFKDLAEFCKSELKGYTADSQYARKRLVRQTYVIGHYPNSLLYSVDEIESQLDAKELPLFHSMSIREIEDELKSYTFSRNKKEWKFTHSNFNESLLTNFSPDENRKISRIYTNKVYKDIYNHVKSILFEDLSQIKKQD